MLPDPRLPQVPTLLGADGTALLAAALAPAGVEVAAAHASQVRYEPGRKIVVRYAARVREAGRERVDTMVAIAHRDGPPPGVAVLRGPDDREVGVWRYPNDPWLPGLRTLAYPRGAGPVLAQLGIPAHELIVPRSGPRQRTAGTRHELTVQPLVYRPGQRAVLRIVAPGVELYAKLVRPERAEQVHRLHAELSRHAPVPRSLGWSRDHGLVLLEALPGERLADRLGGSVPVPSPAALLALLDRVAGATVVGASPGPRGVAHHARLLRAVVPEARVLVGELAEAASHDVPADRTIHGDFYEGQVLVRGREVTGLLDVDTARPGSVVEDLGTLLAHLDGLALVRPESTARILTYRRGVERLAREHAAPGTLEAVVTGVLLGLATGPFRLQQPDWPSRTRAWLRLAAAVRARDGRGRAARRRRVRMLSPPRHGDLTGPPDSEGRKVTTTSRRDH